MSATSSDKPVFARLLDEEFNRRLSRNPRYSLRAFAKSLGMHPSTLGRIQAGRQTPSAKACALLIAKLKLDEAQRLEFLDSVVEAKAFEARARLAALAGRGKLAHASEGAFSLTRSLKLSQEAITELRRLTERFLEEAEAQAADEGTVTFQLLVQLAAVTPRKG